MSFLKEPVIFILVTECQRRISQSPLKITLEETKKGSKFLTLTNVAIYSEEIYTFMERFRIISIMKLCAGSLLTFISRF